MARRRWTVDSGSAYASRMSPERRVLLRRILAVAFVLRALTNLGKPFGTGTGLVFFGKLLTGTPMLVLSPLLGVYMIVWAYGLWHARPWARPVGAAYVALVLVNVLRFPVEQPLPPGVTLPMYALYGIAALGVPMLALWLLRDALGDPRPSGAAAATPPGPQRSGRS